MAACTCCCDDGDAAGAPGPCRLELLRASRGCREHTWTCRTGPAAEPAAPQPPVDVERCARRAALGSRWTLGAALTVWMPFQREHGAPLEDMYDLSEDKVVAMNIMKKLHPKGTKRMKEVFVMYSKFNSRGPRATEKQAGLTNSKYAKLCRECNIVNGKHLTMQDADVAYTSVKEKGRSSINFMQFKQALRILAQRIVDDEEDDTEEDAERTYELLIRKVEQSSGPALTADTSGSPPPVAGEDIKRGSVYEKLVDHKAYVGAHRYRFDDGGIGQGLGPNRPTGAGRLGRMLEREFTLGMHQLVRPQYGGAAVLKDSNLTTDVIQSMGKSPPPKYLKPVHRGRSLDSMQPLRPKLRIDRMRGSNAGWF